MEKRADSLAEACAFKSNYGGSCQDQWSSFVAGGQTEDRRLDEGRIWIGKVAQKYHTFGHSVLCGQLCQCIGNLFIAGMSLGGFSVMSYGQKTHPH
jgi:hypothetical protein